MAFKGNTARISTISHICKILSNYPSSPASSNTAFHSSAVTGCTDSREIFTSAISLNRLSALIWRKLTGLFKVLAGSMSTATQLVSSVVGS